MDKELKANIEFIETVLAAQDVSRVASSEKMVPYHSYALNVGTLNILAEDWARENAPHIAAVNTHRVAYEALSETADETEDVTESDTTLETLSQTVARLVKEVEDMVKDSAEDEDVEPEKPDADADVEPEKPEEKPED